MRRHIHFYKKTTYKLFATISILKVTKNMKMLKITDDIHKRLVNLSKASGIAMSRLVSGVIGGLSDRDLINAYSLSILAIFENKVDEK